MNDQFVLTEFLLWYGASNLVLALPVALLAWWIQTHRRLPFLAHLLWLLVLLKLVTPPFVSIPVFSMEPGNTQFVTTSLINGDAVGSYFDWKGLTVVVWIVGSSLILAWSLYCILRFRRLLSITSVPAGADLQRSAQESALDLGLKKVPAILTTSADVVPMVWWAGGHVRIYLPAALVSALDPAQLRLIMAHELGHVRRGDHFIRWFEWLVSVGLWWNPLAWWARRNLRISEELCCDALVISKLKLRHCTYARSLVSTLEILASPAIRSPAMATGINGGGFMERRIKMIVSKRSISLMPRWLRNAVLLCAAVALPLGFSVAQDAGDGGLDQVRNWLESGVNSAFLTQEQADIMLRAPISTQSGDEVVSSFSLKKTLALAEFKGHLEQQFELGQLTEEQARAQLAELGGATFFPRIETVEAD